MAQRHVQRGDKRTAEQIARDREIREKFQKERPTLDELVASGDYTEPITQQEYCDIHQFATHLKRVRHEQGLSLADLAQRTGIDRSALSRLENGIYDNPTVSTLSRYAHALGKQIVVQVVDLPTDEARAGSS